MQRRKRKDCFFGVHFDFHAAQDCVAIGANTTEEQIQEMLDTVRPDFVQCDCKGHRGFTSYVTKVGTSAPGFAKDNLRIWRDVTAKAGVPLFLHYSGVFDMAAVKDHPQWAIVDGEGKVSPDYTSLKGGYCDGLMIPQLLEVIEKYDVDGVWVDGEAWAVKPDYSQQFLAAFHKDTGCKTAPKTPEDPDYEIYMNYLRQSFLEYLRHYTSEIHKVYPDFQIASNWAFSSYLPEQVTAQVDYLSADYDPLNSYNTARFEARYLATQGMPWDIMGWSFVVSPTEHIPSTKSACQIAREAAVPLSLGGGFQVYIQQKRDGSVEKWMLPVVGEVSRFCNDRKEACFRGENVPQVAVFLSSYHYYKTARRVLHPDKEFSAVRGITQALLDNQLSVQIISEHHLKQDLMKYPVLVLPETGLLEQETVELLHTYMEQGGHLIAAGPLAAQYFLDTAGAEPARLFAEDERKRLANCQTLDDWNRAAETIGIDTKRYLGIDGWLTGLDSVSVAATPKDGTQVLGTLHGGNSFDGVFTPAATCRPAGKGSCTCVWVNTGERYLNAQRFAVRDFWGKLVNNVFTPIAKVAGSHLVDVNISRKNDNLLVHLINTSGSHSDDRNYIYDEITPLRNLALRIRCPACPKQVKTVPETPLKWRWADGTVYVELEQLDIYTIIVVQEEDAE